MKSMPHLLVTAGFACGYTVAAPFPSASRLIRHRQSLLIPTRKAPDFLPSKLFSVTSAGEEGEEAGKLTWLVVGDGDLSYCASLAPTLDKGIELVATVLEDEHVHNKIYRDSSKHTKTIRDIHGHTTKFGVDATKLESIFPNQQFDRIIFNFPHWPGKANNRYNRELIDGFLCSAAKALKRNPLSEIHIAFCDKQGGFDTTSMREWKTSWKVAAYAANYGLLVRRIEEFRPRYNLSSFRKRDRGLTVGKDPQVYVFSWPSRERSLSNYDFQKQIAFRFELRLEMDAEKLENCPHSHDALVHGDIIPELVRKCTSEDYHCETPIRALIYRNFSTFPVLAFLVVYAGHHKPLSRDQAQNLRVNLERRVSETLHLDMAKRGQLVSMPFPYHLLQVLLDDFRSSNPMTTKS